MTQPRPRNQLSSDGGDNSVYISPNPWYLVRHETCNVPFLLRMAYPLPALPACPATPKIQ